MIQFNFAQGDKVICNGRPGTVKKVWSDRTVDVELGSDVVSAPAGYPEVYPIDEKAFLVGLVKAAYLEGHCDSSKGFDDVFPGTPLQDWDDSEVRDALLSVVGSSLI